MLIREVIRSDLPDILEIHNHAIRTSLAIWMDDPVELGEREAWLKEHESAGHPVLIAEVDGAIAGYGSYGAWRSKWGYRHTVEDSVYVVDRFQRQGIGRALVERLIMHARNSGMHAMIADIEAGNRASILLHESLGFRREGTIREVGTKYGRWLDLAVLRLPLSGGAGH